MTRLLAPSVGAVFSADIAVPEHARELRFYSRVLSTGENTVWREDLMNNLGMPIIGLGELTDAYADLPRQWMPHIQVADVGASVQRALDLGGTALMDARDSDGRSQWAVIRDPNGAAFGLVPVVLTDAMPVSNPESGGQASVGRIVWLDLTVPDAESTREFYRQVVGWSAQDVAMRDLETSYADYNMLREDGEPAAGVCHARGMNADLPPVWMIYLPVGDLVESLRRVEAEGGRILKAAKRPDGSCAYAAVQDPLGVPFALTPA